MKVKRWILLLFVFLAGCEISHEESFGLNRRTPRIGTLNYYVNGAYLLPVEPLVSTNPAPHP